MANIYNKIFTRGTASELKTTPVTDGKVRLTLDDEELYFDYGLSNKRIHISDFVTGYTENEIKSLASPLSNKFYVASDTIVIWYYKNNKWYQLSSVGHLRYATKDFTISSNNWVPNDDTTTNEKYHYKQLISSTDFDDSSCCDAEILAANPSLNPTLQEETNAGYIRGYASYSRSGITLLATEQPEVNLTLRVVIDPTTTADYDFGLVN